MVGGVRGYIRYAGTEGHQYYTVPKADQKRAVDFLNQNAFRVTTYLQAQDVLRRFEPAGAVDRVLSSQTRILNSLFNNARVERLIEQEALAGADAYSLEEMIADVRTGIWSELEARQVTIDPYRRNLQRAYLELFDERLNGEDAPDNDLRPLIRGELRALDTDLQRAASRAASRLTRLHIEDCRTRIARILDPR
jgi:hypothetical protein